MSEERDKHYCITLETDAIKIMILLPMSDEHLDLIKENDAIGWTFGNAIQMLINKPDLENFDIQLVQ